MKTDIEALRDKVTASRKAVGDVEYMIRLEKDAASKAVDLKYDTQLDAASKALNAAAGALKDATDAEALADAKKDLVYPEGTVLRRNGNWRGKVEIITPDSVHPENIGWNSRAAVGKVVIRQIKKDGTDSKKYWNPSDYSFRWATWRPEGVNPNAERSAAEEAKRAEEDANKERENKAALEALGL